MLLVTYDPKESTVSVEEKTEGERDKDTNVEEVVLPPNKESEDKIPLRWSIKKQKGKQRQEKGDWYWLKVVRSYSTRGSKKKMLGDAIKASKSSTTKRRRLTKVVVVEEEKM